MQTTDFEIQNDIRNVLRKFGDVLYGFAYVGDILFCYSLGLR